MTEGNQFPRVQNEFCKMSRVQVVYVGGKKNLPELEGWKRKMMRVMHNIFGGSTDKGYNVILLIIRDIEKFIFS